MPSDAFLPGFTTKAPPWHGWVTADLFLLSLASGTFAIASLFVLVRPYEMEGVVRTGFHLVFPLMAADLVCLIADLGDPMRFHHMLRTFNPRSPMSLGVWTISILSAVTFAGMVAAVLDLPLSALRAIAAAGIVPSLVAGAYKGAAFALSTMAMGAALMLAIAAFKADFPAARISRFILMWLLVLLALAVRRLMGGVGTTGHLGEVADRASMVRTSLHYTMFIVGGIGLPIVLCALSSGSAALDFLIAGIVEAGALASRHYLVMIPHRARGAPVSSSGT
jgi:hypothetical protein